MSFTQVPHEIQLHIFGYLLNDYAALLNVSQTSTHLRACALQLLRTCRTLDLSEGITDGIEAVLSNLHELASNGTPPPPHAPFTSLGDLLGDNIVGHASRYNSLKVFFGDRVGATGEDTQAIVPDDMNIFILMMQVLTGKTRRELRSWRKNFRLRKVEPSLRLILYAMRHVRTLELGGSAKCLPWKMEGMLTTLRTLKLYDITNNQLTRHCCTLAAQPGLTSLEFSDMNVTLGFLEHFKPSTPIMSLRFTRCWVPKLALTRIISACSNLVTFEYTLDTARSEAQPYQVRQWQTGKLLSDLRRHAHTLKHLKIVRLGTTTTRFWLECDHVGSLAVFNALETLTVNPELLAPHHDACHVQDDCSRRADMVAVLFRAPQSLQTLRLARCNNTVIARLSRVVASMGLSGLLSNLRDLEIVYTTPLNTLQRNLGQPELALRDAFGRRGVDVKFSHSP